MAPLAASPAQQLAAYTQIEISEMNQTQLGVLFG
jgi:hypothetical protein